MTSREPWRFGIAARYPPPCRRGGAFPKRTECISGAMKASPGRVGIYWISREPLSSGGPIRSRVCGRTALCGSTSRGSAFGYFANAYSILYKDEAVQRRLGLEALRWLTYAGAPWRQRAPADRKGNSVLSSVTEPGHPAAPDSPVGRAQRTRLLPQDGFRLGRQSGRFPPPRAHPLGPARPSSAPARNGRPRSRPHSDLDLGGGMDGYAGDPAIAERPDSMASRTLRALQGRTTPTTAGCNADATVCAAGMPRDL